jgi:hypothetical protein
MLPFPNLWKASFCFEFRPSLCQIEVIIKDGPKEISAQY